MTFRNFRNLSRQLRDFGKLPRSGAYSDKRGHQIAEFLGIQLTQYLDIYFVH